MNSKNIKQKKEKTISINIFGNKNKPSAIIK